MPDDAEAMDAAPANDGSGGTSGGGDVKIRASCVVRHVLQTIIQHAAEANHDAQMALSGVLGSLENKYLAKTNWNSNPGRVVEALLHAAGLAWSASGKKLWRRADPVESIEWRTPAKVGSSVLRRQSRRRAGRRAARLHGVPLPTPRGSHGCSV